MRAREILEMRTDSEEFDNLDRADKWLARYTYENLDKWPPKEVLETLVRRYPVKAPITVYRGMNFSTREQWEEFEADLKTGQIKFGGISSWGRDGDSVEQFAVTKPSYHLDYDTMREYGAARSEREYIAGYRGVVIKTTVQPGQGIDVNASNLGHEDEIILVPGTYVVEVHRMLKRYRDALDDGDVDIDTAITDPKSERPYDVGLSDYVLHHHTDRLSDATRHFMFKRELAKLEGRDRGMTEIRQHIREPFRGMDREGTRPTCQVGFPTVIYDEAMAGRYTAQDTQFVKEQAAKAVANLIREFRKIASQRPEMIFEHMGHYLQIARWAGAGDKLFAVLKQHVGRQYRELELEGRKMNGMEFKDKWAMRAHLEDHGKKVVQVLSQIR